MPTFEVPEVDYTRYSNRQLAAVPLAVLALALLVLVAWYVAFGSPVILGIEFTGGTELVVQTDNPDQIADVVEQNPESVRAIQSEESLYIVTYQAAADGSDDPQVLREEFERQGYDIQSVRSTLPTFAADTQTTALYGLAAAFVGMSLLVFVLFRTFVPSVAVVVSAFSDIIIPLALMNVFGIKLSLGTVAALLMLIGYSVDSDILLNNHILRRSGGFYESTYRAMRTGVTMTLTSLSALTVMTIVAWLFGIQLLTDIGIVLVFGLSADLMNTYMLNLSLLRWYKYEGVAR